jgi:hypothetical protein
MHCGHVCGNHVDQKVSDVQPEKLTFDFSNNEPATVDRLKEVQVQSLSNSNSWTYCVASQWVAVRCLHVHDRMVQCNVENARCLTAACGHMFFVHACWHACAQCNMMTLQDACQKVVSEGQGVFTKVVPLAEAHKIYGLRAVFGEVSLFSCVFCC